MARALTQRQLDVLTFIARTVEQTGQAPALVAIGREFGNISLPSVEKHIEALERKGYIERRRHQRPPIVLLHTAPQQLSIHATLDVPIHGAVVAACPLRFAQPPFEQLTIEAELVERSSTVVALRVEGYGLVNEALLPGDVLLIRPGKLFDHGDTVVALVNGGATVKRVEGSGDTRMLLSAHPSGEPLAARGSDVFGVVIAVQRRLPHSHGMGGTDGGGGERGNNPTP
jgi:repressor LexA